jgi:hypothetical protein
MQLALRICRFGRGAPWRRLIAAIALVAFAFAATGFPVPQFTAVSGEKFICQHRGCGCASADQCWRSCCCFSLEERVAWAKKHQVKPPKAALAQMQREREQTTALASGSCCATVKKTCCSPAKKPSCCDAAPSSASGKKQIVWHSSLLAQKCRGLTSSWSALSVPIHLPPAHVQFTYEAPCVQTLAMSDARASCIAYKILTPPG